MKIVKKDGVNPFPNSRVCTAFEYPLDDPDMNGSIIELKGRYPEKGWTVNERCKEIAYIFSGMAKLDVDGKEHELEPGDVVLIKPGEKFFWMGNCKMFMVCNPAFNPKQHKIVT